MSPELHSKDARSAQSAPESVRLGADQLKPAAVKPGATKQARSTSSLKSKLFVQLNLFGS